jgi:lipopolysaccharide/colanic/teichoic acid biosynthesis glycosyltransferase
VRLGRKLLPDFLLVLLATGLAVLLRDNFDISQDRMAALFPYGSFTLVFTLIALPSLGVARVLWRFTSMRDYIAIVTVATLIVVGALAAAFVHNRLDGVARSLPILQGMLIVFLLVGARVLARLWHGSSIRATQIQPFLTRETVLLVGFNKLTELYLHCVAERRAEHLRIAGILDPGGRVGVLVNGIPVLGLPEQVADVLRDLEIRGIFVNRIIITAPVHSLGAAALDALCLIETSKTIAVEFLGQKMGFDQPVTETGWQSSLGVAGVKREQVFALRSGDAHAASSYASAKRILDCLAAFVLLVALSPVIAVVGILVALDVGLPIMFWQERPGLLGRPFRVFKFRAMGAAHDAQGRRRSDAERVSAIGRFLRRARLDELPQLFSILAGRMSFVGPRPLLPVDQSDAYAARLLVRPGLTGWAQINGGRTISAADKAALDVWYVHNVSLALDVKILFATIPMVLFGERVIHQAIARAWRDLQAAGLCATTALVSGTAPEAVSSDR